MNRRNFFKTTGLTIGSTLIGGKLMAAANSRQEEAEKKEFLGVLIDTTRCIGCRNCETVCAESNGLPEPPEENLEIERKTTETQWTVVNEYQSDEDYYYAKKQCMHCDQPACASACLTKAMVKTKEGPVIWREDKCMGCRACMISCPFDIPKFEANSPNPKIQKCQMCFDRMVEGESPVCVENCYGDALQFGKQRELMEIAKTRIYSGEEDYVHHIYGEHEAGGTGVVYIASVPFEKLGFNTNIEEKPYPEYSKGFLYSVPFILILWPAFLLALNDSIKKDKEKESIAETKKIK